MTAPYGRRLACVHCGHDVIVFEARTRYRDETGQVAEADHQWIDPARFVCGPCLEAGERRPDQLELDVDEPPTEERSYDPDLADIPF